MLSGVDGGRRLRAAVRRWIAGGVLCLWATGALSAPDRADGGCTGCHPFRSDMFAVGHEFAATGCTACHAGDAAADTEDAAHRGLIAFPGNLDTAETVCGACHPRQWSGVSESLMHTGRLIVETTRQVLEGNSGPPRPGTLSDLGHGPSDSLLRKLCAGCHLGKLKQRHAHDPSGDRGGGCLACHINDHASVAHPRLTARVSDARCFGCHARSGRIALNYAGLAEVDPGELRRRLPHGLGRLPDGRLVERLPADVHHRAGMACIDCHTGRGLMGSGGHVETAREAVDIGCADCHDGAREGVPWRDWPAGTGSLERFVPFPVGDDQRFLTTRRNNTPLWHIELRDGAAFLHSKLGGAALRIPRIGLAEHAGADHARLRCEACHSRWAPQCYGCHLSFDPDAPQWDHLEERVTPGRWRERRWAVRNGPAPLGVTGDGTIGSFVPGMVLLLDHPDLGEGPLFRRFFAQLSPHTSGSARTCASCHRSSLAVGLGHGPGPGGEDPDLAEVMPDGLPLDAWVAADGDGADNTLPPTGRPLNARERLRVLSAPLSE